MVVLRFLKSYLQTYPFIKSLVLGISGGQDPTLAGKLCQMAINALRLETGNEWLPMPYACPMVFRPTNKIARMPLPLFNRIAYSR